MRRSLVILLVVSVIIVLLLLFVAAWSFWETRVISVFQETICDCPQGDTGAKGNTGIHGLTGPQGNTGDPGNTGPKGPIGLQGSTGQQGQTGDTGPLGGQGPTGNTGANGVLYHINAVQSVDDNFFIKTGSTIYEKHCAIDSLFFLIVVNDNRINKALPPELASSGDLSQHLLVYDCITGLWQDLGQFTAKTGPTGPKGDTGQPGDTGPQGQSGATGAVGATGSQGVTGNTGSPGATGGQGQTGNTGPQGPQGDTGDTGPGPNGSIIPFGNGGNGEISMAGNSANSAWITWGVARLRIPSVAPVIVGLGGTISRNGIIDSLVINLFYKAGPNPNATFSFRIWKASPGDVPAVLTALQVLALAVPAGTSTTVSFSMPVPVLAGDAIGLEVLILTMDAGSYLFNVGGAVAFH